MTDNIMRTVGSVHIKRHKIIKTGSSNKQMINMCRAYGSLTAGYVKYNGLKSVVTKQKRAYGSTFPFVEVAPNCG